MRILVLNGPNLNLLGQRPSSLYGDQGMEGIIEELRQAFPEGSIEHVQSNHEGELLDAIHRADREHDGIVINPAAYTHTSVALGDAVEAVRIPVIEVHLSNILARERFRHISYVAPHANGTIMGFGSRGYRAAVEELLRIKGS
jgi:3-dehydroquinate dehydratase-2